MRLFISSRNQCKNGQALIAHCQDAGDWYHDMYHIFLTKLYQKRTGATKKRKIRLLYEYQGKGNYRTYKE